MTMFSIGSLVGQVLCIHCTICSNRRDCDGEGWGVGREGEGEGGVQRFCKSELLTAYVQPGWPLR
jgi:hypothetical protein